MTNANTPSGDTPEKGSGGRLTVLHGDGEYAALRRYMTAADVYDTLAQISVANLRSAIPVKSVRLTTADETVTQDLIELELGMAWGRDKAWQPILVDALTAKVRERLPELVLELQQDAKRVMDREADYIRGVLRLEPLEGALTMNGRSLTDVPKPEASTKFNPAKDSPETAIQMARVIGDRDKAGEPY